MPGVAEAAISGLDLPNLAVVSFAHRVGHGMGIVGQDVTDVPADRLRRLRYLCLRHLNVGLPPVHRINAIE